MRRNNSYLAHMRDKALHALRAYGHDVEACALYETLIELIDYYFQSTRPDAEALRAVPDLNNACAMVLYFPNDVERREFEKLVKAEHPTFATLNI